MNTLITGINGFIGGAYAARLRVEGRHAIVGIDVQPAAATPCDNYLQLDLGSVTAAEALRDLPAFDRVLHAGGISGFMVETGNPQRIFDVNVAGTMAVLDMARRMACRRLVLCSTLMVYGPDDGPAALHEEGEYPRPITLNTQGGDAWLRSTVIVVLSSLVLLGALYLLWRRQKSS